VRADVLVVVGSPWKLGLGSFMQLYSSFGNSPLLSFSINSCTKGTSFHMQKMVTDLQKVGIECLR
jgi:hypothetical protein